MNYRVLVAVGLILTARAGAETFTLPSQPSDGSVTPSGLAGVGVDVASVGLYTTAGYGRAAVLPFAFPKMAFADQIVGAGLALNLKSFTGTGIAFNGDLYSLGVSSSDAIAGADYFNGTYGSDAGATALQAQLLTPATPIGAVALGSGGAAKLATDLEACRKAGTTAGSYYFLRVSPDLATLASAAQSYNLSMSEDAAKPSLVIQTGPQPALGRVLIEYWTGIAGGAVSDLTGNAAYPNQPNARELPTVMEIPQNLDTNSGSRIRALFYPPATGNYTFGLAGDDSGELWLSTDATPAHAAKIAFFSAATGYQQWNAAASQTSAARFLYKNVPYYIESRHKQGGGNGCLSIGWMYPGATAMSLMSTLHCAPYDPNAGFGTAAALQAGLSQSHPRLLLSAAAVARLKALVAVAGTTPNTWYAALQTSGTAMLSQPVVDTGIPATQSTLINAARTLQDRVYTLGFLYLLSASATDQANYLNKIYAELTATASWGGGTWSHYQFLDLPEVCHAYAIAYDWLYNAWTPAQRSYLSTTVGSAAFTPALAGYAAATPTWVNGPTNWTIVCDGGLAVTALAFLGDNASAPAILDHALPDLWSAPVMAGLGPDGASPEADCYWTFEVRYLATLFASLETASGTCFNFDQLDGMSSLGSFPAYEIGPVKKTFNYGDEYQDGVYSLTNGQALTPGLQYLGLKYNQPVYSWQEKRFPQPYPTDLIWYDARTVAPVDLGLPPSTYYRGAGVVILRTAWNDGNALFGGLKAGSNAADHTQLELGDFVFDALGVRWAVDLGRDSYSLAGYFDLNPADAHNRWQYYRCRAEGNNTLVINPSSGPDQAVAATATVTKFATNSAVQEGVIDMSAAYPAATRVQRGLRFVGGVAQVQDEMTASSAVNLTWFMHTATAIAINPGGQSAILSSGTKRLLATIQSPAGAVFTSSAAVPLATSPHPAAPNANDPNTGITKLCVNVPAASSVTLTISLAPYVSGSAAPAPPPVTALSGW